MNNERLDFTNEEVITKILEGDSIKSIEELRNFHNLSPEKIELMSKFAKLRKQVKDDCWRKVEKRKSQSPKFSNDENDLGCFIEAIEPQVRLALLALRKKGYDTFESGFCGFNKQNIGLSAMQLVNFNPPENLISYLKAKNVTLKISPDNIEFECNKFLDLDELKNIWDQVEQNLPDLNK